MRYMADNKPKKDRKDEKAYDKSEVDNYDSDVGGAGGQAGGNTDHSDLESSNKSEEFYADDEEAN